MTVAPVLSSNSYYGEHLLEIGMAPSVGSKGDSYDNALAEMIQGLHKAGLIYRRTPWKTREAVELVTLEWVVWFNNHQLLESIGYMPSSEAEINYYRNLSRQTITVWLTQNRLHNFQCGSQ